MATLGVSGVVLFIKEAYKPYKFHKDVKAALENFGKAGADGEFCAARLCLRPLLEDIQDPDSWHNQQTRDQHSEFQKAVCSSAAIIDNVGKVLAKHESLRACEGRMMDRVKFSFTRLTPDLERVHRMFSHLQRVEYNFGTQTFSRLHKPLEADNKRIPTLFESRNEEAWPALVTGMLQDGFTKGYVEEKEFEYRIYVVGQILPANWMCSLTPGPLMGHSLRESTHVTSLTSIQNNITDLSATADATVSPEEPFSSQGESDVRDSESAAGQQKPDGNPECLGQVRRMTSNTSTPGAQGLQRPRECLLCHFSVANNMTHAVGD